MSNNVSYQKIDFHEDDRAQRLFNVYDELGGQINVTYVNSANHTVAWHRHEKQTDYWFCSKGSFRESPSRSLWRRLEH